MRCAYAASVGGDDPVANLAVGDLDDTTPEDGEVLVAVKAASLNHHDLWTLRGVASRPVVPPQVLGCDAAGVVETYGGSSPVGVPPVGSRVLVYGVLGCRQCDACQRGDLHLCRKVGILSDPGYPGSLSTRLVVPAENLITLPDQVSWEHAACLPTTFLTAQHALFVRGGLRAGDTVLIHGASGGVSSAAMLLCKRAGVNALVTSRSPQKSQRAVDMGMAQAGFGVDALATKAVMAHTGGRGVDCVLDSVGEAVWEMSLRVLRPGGTVVTVGATSGAGPKAQLNRIFWRQLTVAGSTMGTRAELEELVSLCAEGQLTPMVDQVFGLEQTAAALRQLAEGEAFGKLVVRVSD